jgi:chromosomal replication initiator protein
MTNETWGLVREELIKRVGKNNYVTWIEPLKLSLLKNGVARFEVPTIFFGDWVQRNYSDHIRTQLSNAGAQVDRVEFAVGAEAAPRNAAPRPSPSRRQSLRARGLRMKSFRARRWMPVSPSTASSSASRTSLPMPPRAAWPKAGR